MIANYASAGIWIVFSFWSYKWCDYVQHSICLLIEMNIFFFRVHLEGFIGHIPAASETTFLHPQGSKVFLKEGYWCHGCLMWTDPTLGDALMTTWWFWPHFLVSSPEERGWANSLHLYIFEVRIEQDLLFSRKKMLVFLSLFPCRS